MRATFATFFLVLREKSTRRLFFSLHAANCRAKNVIIITIIVPLESKNLWQQYYEWKYRRFMPTAFI
jgi:hypothetical protein